MKRLQIEGLGLGDVVTPKIGYMAGKLCLVTHIDLRSQASRNGVVSVEFGNGVKGTFFGEDLDFVRQKK